MQVKKIGNNLYELKSKETTIALDGGIEVVDKKIDSPGEYEIGGIFITGIPAGDQTIFILEVEDLNLCFLGQLKKNLPQSTLEQIEDIDILFLPTGAEGTIDLKTASSILQKIDPKMVIPIYLENEAEFLKQEGEASPRREKGLKITKSQLPNDEERQLVILE
jgi:L-ascorbate metabolism protein UlaG (beta-lactamase superfamily)